MQTFELANPLQHDPPGRHEVHDLQRALQAAKLYQGSIDGIFGSGTAHACKDAKYRLGYPLRAVLPTGGQTLFNFLTGAVALPALYRARRRLRGYGLTRDGRIRSQVVQWARWGVAHTGSIHYSMGGSRGDWLRRLSGTLPLTTDCSGFVTACYRWAGANDPNGLGYRQVGYTGTLLDHGTAIPLYQAKPGDLAIWGWSPGHHVAVIVDVSNRADPLIVSHGSERGPVEIRLSQEDSAQNRHRVIKRYI